MSRSKSQRRSMLAIFSRSICIRILCPSLFKISVKSLFPTLAELSPSSTTLNILFEDIFRIFQYLSRKYICACCFRLARSTYHVSQAISRVKEVTLESKLIGDATKRRRRPPCLQHFFELNSTFNIAITKESCKDLRNFYFTPGSSRAIFSSAWMPQFSQLRRN